MPTKIMGILNITHDSYYAKSCFPEIDQALKEAHKMQEEGADFLDIGGCSTRPGSTPVSLEEEIKRTLPLIELLKREISIPISIDTYRFEVAQRAVDAGVDFLNDITGFVDPKMQQLAKRSQLPICIMHMQNTPETMQNNPSYPRGVVEEIQTHLLSRAQELEELGIAKENIFLDPGIGFGKTVEDNLLILQHLDKLREMNHPLFVGISRKSFIQKLTKQPAEGALYGTLAINALLVDRGVEIIRVHDVAAHRDLVTVVDSYNSVTLSPK